MRKNIKKICKKHIFEKKNITKYKFRNIETAPQAQLMEKFYERIQGNLLEVIYNKH